MVVVVVVENVLIAVVLFVVEVVVVGIVAVTDNGVGAGQLFGGPRPQRVRGSGSVTSAQPGRSELPSLVIWSRGHLLCCHGCGTCNRWFSQT